MKKKRFGIIKQMYLLAVAALIVVGLITYFTQYQISIQAEKKEVEKLATRSALEVRYAVEEYSSSEWLLKYWYDHADELELEYDVGFDKGTETQKKEELLRERHPSFQPQYASAREVEAFPEEDQKLFAEITYSWLITRINQIKRSYGIDFLFCVVTDTEAGEHPYETQFFLFSGSNEGDKRGTEYLEIYPIGVEVSTAENKSQQEIMRKAVNRAERNQSENVDEKEETFGSLAYAGDYVDYYECVELFDDKAVLIGLTYNIAEIRASIRQQTVFGTLCSVLYEFILLQLIVLILFLFGIRPLKKVVQAIRTYTENKNSKEVEENLNAIQTGISGSAIRNNEIGDLSDNMIGLANEIDDYTNKIETITASNERINAELNFAANIQKAMLPQKFPAFPDRHEFRVFASMDPAREVGGDFYDFFLIDEDHLVVVIADVSGKGIPAALFMMASQIVIHDVTMLSSDPGTILERANREILKHNMADMFVTVWLGVLEISTGKLMAANAGHEYPVLRKADGSFELLKDKHGFVIGGMEGVKYKTYEIQMEPGTKLFVYTDGVPEATNGEKELFGTERMLAALNEAPDVSPEQVLGNMRKAVDAFVGEEEQFDDLTMLCLEYKGTEAEKEETEAE